MKIVIVTGVTVGLAERIIDDTCLVSYLKFKIRVILIALYIADHSLLMIVSAINLICGLLEIVVSTVSAVLSCRVNCCRDQKMLQDSGHVMYTQQAESRPDDEIVINLAKCSEES